jgi:hypothetical protein
MAFPICSSLPVTVCSCTLPYVPPMSHGHLDRYSFVRFLSIDDPPADMLENTPRVESVMTPSTMYSPLMPLSRCFLHLIYLTIYVFSYMSTLVRGHGPHYTWPFFFWRFQPPDALYMLSRLYRKVNPFRSNLLLLLVVRFVLKLETPLTHISQKSCPMNSLPRSRVIREGRG